MFCIERKSWRLLTQGVAVKFKKAKVDEYFSQEHNQVLSVYLGTVYKSAVASDKSLCSTYTSPSNNLEQSA